MPTRAVTIVILVGWVASALTLLLRDVAPQWLPSRSPDLRAVARAGPSGEPTRWEIQVVNNALKTSKFRPIGEATTRTRRKPDGRATLTSQVQLDTAGLLRGTPLPIPEAGEAKVLIDTVFEIAASGDLDRFRAEARNAQALQGEVLIVLEGQRRGEDLAITVRSGGGVLFRRDFPYPRRGMVQSSLSPVDRMPGLSLGQSWGSQVVNPLTGSVENATVEVKRMQVIQWRGKPVETFEVVSTMKPITVRTWVRADGLVLRQEVPLPLVKLNLERLDDDDDSTRERTGSEPADPSPSPQ